MTDEERYKQALIILTQNVDPAGDFRPMAMQMCAELAEFGYKVLEGKSIEEAERIARGGS